MILQTIDFKSMFLELKFLRNDLKFLYPALNQFAGKNLTVRELELWEAMEIFTDPISLKAYQPRTENIPTDRSFSFNQNYYNIIKEMWADTYGKILYCRQIQDISTPKNDNRIEILFGEENLKLLNSIIPAVRESERILWDFKRVIENILKELGDKWRLTKKEEREINNPYG